MTEADALKVSREAVSAWLPQLTSWLCLKKANRVGLDTPKARDKTVHRARKQTRTSCVRRVRLGSFQGRIGSSSVFCNKLLLMCA